MKRHATFYAESALILSWLILVAGLCRPAAVSAAMLDTHVVVLDGEGKLIPWTSNPAEGYDRVMYLSWDLLLNRMPKDPANGLPVIYTHSEHFEDTLNGTGWPNNPAGKNAMLADSALLYYAYSGNTNVLNLVRGLLDHQLQYGTTPTNYVWANVPWSTAAASSVTYGNDNYLEGTGVLEPDKVGELGYHGYLKFYELTGDTNYLAAAIACADALVQHARSGTASRSPWPFRVLAQTGATWQQADYCAHVIAPIRLFDELTRLGLGNTNGYQATRQAAWDWLMTYPMSNRVWVSYFEDTTYNLGNTNQYVAGQTARYLLEHPERDPAWLQHATNLLAFIETMFGGTDAGEPGLQYGARVISEQVTYKYKMASHTSRFAANCALLYSRTGDLAAREKAYRSLNWCTYLCRSNGVVIDGLTEHLANSGCWFTDGHGDYIRHFMLAIGAVPEWAPAGQNHITHSTSVIKSVTYAPGSNGVAYTTFDDGSTETLRVAFAPVDVFVDNAPLPRRQDLDEPGWVHTASNGVLRIRHDSGTSVQIVGSTPLITLTNGIHYTNSISGSGMVADRYVYTASDPVARVEFHLLGPGADLTLVVRKGLPQPGLGFFDYISANPATNDEYILLLNDSYPVPASAGEWFLTVINRSGAPAAYAIEASRSAQSGQPIILTSARLESDGFHFSWNSTPGAHYFVQGRTSLENTGWVATSGTITATGSTASAFTPLPSPYWCFRVVEGVAQAGGSPP